MTTSINSPTDAKKLFKKCGTCSQTFAHLLNREFGQPSESAERALDPLAGGIVNQGHQCGMLWGATLAVGTAAFRKYKDLDKATAIAINATQKLIESFTSLTQTVNCREITGCDLSSFFGLMKFMLKTTLQGMDNSRCFNLAEQWAPKAIQSASTGLSEKIEIKEKPINCASEVIKKMGGGETEQVMVAGFAGGLGLSGHACGALGAAIWMKTLDWCKKNPGKTPPFFNNPEHKKILKQFKELTGDEMLCTKITGRRFKDLSEHAKFIKNGGCRKVMDMLADI